MSKTKWFDFDRVAFKEGGTIIIDSAISQIENLAAILKAYPKLKIKIISFTPKGGNEAMNRSLSQAQADSVVAVLKKLGATQTQVLGAEGYGSYYAKYDEDASEFLKQKDRRISINVISK
jgi:outer membrane protein OmpA-like peptidoglycan-associated protein